MSTPIKTTAKDTREKKNTQQKSELYNTKQLIIYIRAWNFHLIGIGLRKIYSTQLKKITSRSAVMVITGWYIHCMLYAALIARANLYADERARALIENMLKVNWFVLCFFGYFADFDFNRQRRSKQIKKENQSTSPKYEKYVQCHQFSLECTLRVLSNIG